MPSLGKAGIYKRDFLRLSSTVVNPLVKVFCNRTMYSKVDTDSNSFNVVLILDKGRCWGFFAFLT